MNPLGRQLQLGALLWGSLTAIAAAQNVSEVQVAPPSITIKVGERYGLLATAYDRAGNVMPTARPIWSSNNVAIARVDNNGTVLAVSSGVAIIEARVGTRRGQAAVQVTGGAAAPPTVTQAPPVQTTGTTTTGVDPLAGQTPGSGAAAALRIDPPQIFLLPSENVRIYPRALREDGSPAAPVAVTWKSLSDDVASVDANGTVVALKTGQGTIQVVGPAGLTATAPIVVQQADFAILGPASVTLAPGEADTLHVVVPAQGNRLVSPLALQWTSSDQSVAQVSLSGVVKAVGSGKATLTVQGLLQQKSIDILVHRAVEAMAVRPRSAVEVQVPVTSTARFSAQALAADNTAVPEARLTWSLADTSLASYDPTTGVLVGKKIGKTQLVVRGPGGGGPPITVTWNVSIVAGAVKLSATRTGIAVGGRTTRKANFADDTGAVIGPATGLSWATDAPAVATVAEDGTVTGLAYGHARITATAPGGKTATAEVFVGGDVLVTLLRANKTQLYWIERANLAQTRRIGTDTAQALDPAISPDGSRIAFGSLRDGNPEIYVMDADGTNLQRLTTDPQADTRPVFSADGATLLFQSMRTGKSEIYQMNVDGSGVKALTTDSVNQTPTVSSDGGTIAFASLRNKNTDIWLMAKDGSNQRPFTKSPQA